MTWKLPDPHECQDELISSMASLGVEITASDIPPMVANRFISSIKCPHGVTYWYEPTNDQQLAWERQADNGTLGLGTRWTSADPEPPVGTTVEDHMQRVWTNTGEQPAPWECSGVGRKTWTKIAGNYGPVTIVSWGGSLGRRGE